MAMIAIPVTHDIGRLFESLDVEGDRRPSDHITVFYLGDDLPIKKIVKIIPVIFEITSKMKPFKVSTNVITTFDEGKHGYPVIAKLQSKELEKLRNDLKKAFDDNKIKYDIKFKEFKPHLTLSYSPEKIKDIKFPKIEFLISQISIFGGDEVDEKVFINFPFSLGIKKKAAYIDQLTDILKGVGNKT